MLALLLAVSALAGALLYFAVAYRRLHASAMKLVEEQSVTLRHQDALLGAQAVELEKQDGLLSRQADTIESLKLKLGLSAEAYADLQLSMRPPPEGP